MTVWARAAFYHKDYEIRSFRDRDVLCDPYVVRKNDYVIRLLKKRGDIAHKDFPRFLEIFKHINPDIRDIDLIHPDQRIFIPLRVLDPDTLEGQASGKVSMPVITITDLPGALKRHSEVYRVEYGDWVSQLIAERFGRHGSESYQEGIELFKKLNPEIEDLSKIKAGTEVRLPDPDIKDQPWYDKVVRDTDSRDKEEKAEENEEIAEPAPPPVQWFNDLSVFARAAEIVGGELIDRGSYFFPSKRGRDVRLDLSATPVIELENGKRLLFTRRQGLADEDRRVVRRYWPELEVVYVSGKPELSGLVEKLVSAIDPEGYEKRVSLEDSGVLIAVRGQFIYNSTGRDSRICLNIISDPDMRTPPAIRDYLEPLGILHRDWVDKDEMSGWVLREPRRKNPSKGGVARADLRDPSSLVEAVAETAGYRYHKNVEVSFPYAGFQVKATTDMLSLNGKAEILVDYGSLKGKAVESIEKSGFRVIQIEGRPGAEQLLDTLENHLPVTCEQDPMFWTANRPRIRNTSVQVPGWLVSADQEEGGKELLVAVEGLAEPLADYLIREQGLGIIRLSR